MPICFNDIYTAAQPADWMTQPFGGFNLDSRKIRAGQIFIALTSFSLAEKTAQFAQAALDLGALAVISEIDLNIE